MNNCISAHYLFNGGHNRNELWTFSSVPNGTTWPPFFFNISHCFHQYNMSQSFTVYLYLKLLSRLLLYQFHQWGYMERELLGTKASTCSPRAHKGVIPNSLIWDLLYQATGFLHRWSAQFHWGPWKHSYPSSSNITGQQKTSLEAAILWNKAFPPLTSATCSKAFVKYVLKEQSSCAEPFLCKGTEPSYPSPAPLPGMAKLTKKQSTHFPVEDFPDQTVQNVWRDSALKAYQKRKHSDLEIKNASLLSNNYSVSLFVLHIHLARNVVGFFLE